MTIYEVPNIEHCEIESVASGRMYRITSEPGWYIHLNDGDPETANLYKTAVVLFTTYDFSLLQIVAEADLPPDAEICGGDTNKPEVM